MPSVTVETKNLGPREYQDAEYIINHVTGNLLVENESGRFRFANGEWLMVTAVD